MRNIDAHNHSLILIDAIESVGLKLMVDISELKVDLESDISII